jgi:hypothetical protein
MFDHVHGQIASQEQFSKNRPSSDHAMSPPRVEDHSGRYHLVMSTLLRGCRYRETHPAVRDVASRLAGSSGFPARGGGHTTAQRTSAAVERVASYASRVEVRLLGALEILDDEGCALGVRGAKPKGLLALLALRAGEVVSAGRVVVDLWGDQDLHDSLNAVRVVVSMATVGW